MSDENLADANLLSNEPVILKMGEPVILEMGTGGSIFIVFISISDGNSPPEGNGNIGGSSLIFAFKVGLLSPWLLITVALRNNKLVSGV